jgi:RNA polymerase sigma factor (sigma-70 family)
MPENDAVLLERFSRRADAEAFTELVHRYARLVYSTSWRVLRHETDAADVTQETFFELTRQADRIVGPLSGWLHRVATQKSIDVIRRRTHRRNREQTYARARPVEVQTWHDLSSGVDEALEKLDESLRHLLLDHFLAGKTTGQIAQERGISQATVSRRINEGLGQLRGMLRRQGLLVGAAALGTMLLENTSQAVPAAVCAGLSKMAMIGTTGTSVALGGKASVAISANTVKVVLATATIVAAASVVGYVHHSRGPEPPAQYSVPTNIVRQPAPRNSNSRSYPAGRTTTTREAQPEGEGTAAATSSAAEQTPTPELFLGPFGPSPGVGGMGGMSVGDPFSGVPTADLRTPEAVVYSFLTLIDQGATEQLGECLAEGAEVTADSPFPRDLGYPIRLVEVAQDGDTAQVSWEATARTPFSYKGKEHLPGEFVVLCSQLVRVDGRWKLLKLDQ